MVLNERDATIQLCGLVSHLVEVPHKWSPFTEEADDRLIYDWVKHPDNGWCSGKKQDFELLLPTEYSEGDYARTVLLVFGIQIK